MNVVNFNKSYTSKNEREYVNRFMSYTKDGERDALEQRCLERLKTQLQNPFLCLTSSGTASLEITCLLSNISAGDEVILPSYTFSSTANCVALRGGVPVFVDIKPSTLNIDENLVEAAITSKTRAIIVVHYAGIACNMKALLKIAKAHKLVLIEDAAQAFGSCYEGQALGTIGDFGAISFHKTKNVQCGEGGLVISSCQTTQNEASYAIEKGTNRIDKISGKVSKYQWVRLGSSYVLSDIQLALLAGQLEDKDFVTWKRIQIWEAYQNEFKSLENEGLIQRPVIEPGSTINGHIYYIILDERFERQKIQEKLFEKGVVLQTHYEPLHLAPAGLKHGRKSSNLNITEDYAKRLLRLPIWPDMSAQQIRTVIGLLFDVLKK